MSGHAGDQKQPAPSPRQEAAATQRAGDPGPVQPSPEAKEEERPSVASRSALQVMYCLMAIDGQLHPAEEEKLDAIGRELLPDEYDRVRNSLFASCRSKIGTPTDAEESYDVISDCARDALDAPVLPHSPVLPSRLLIWNLLAIAESDNSYSRTEKRFIQSIARMLRIGHDVFLELESTMETLQDLEHELDTLKASDRPYAVVSPRIQEINTRISHVMASVEDLAAM